MAMYGKRKLLTFLIFHASRLSKSRRSHKKEYP